MQSVSSQTPRTAPAPARRCACAVLRRVFEDGAYADRAFHAQARTLAPRDRGLAMRLAYGAVQRRGTLDFFIERLAERDLGQLDPAALAALRLGLYELLYLAGAPDHAVLDGAVQLAREQGSRGHGLVNAVLRRAVRERTQLLEELSDGTPEQAAVMHSHPEWIARMWWRELGAPAARALMICNNEPSEVALRVNTLLSDRDAVASELGVASHADQALPEALVLEGPFDVHGSPMWRSGAVVAQARAAMRVARMLDPKPGERVLDLCAAPGGKSTHIAALMGGRGTVVALERHPRRAAALARTVARLHAGNVHVELGDARVARPEGAIFDRVLVDPPCSGLGILQAKPDLRWRASPERMGQLRELQAQILTAALEALRPGGVLVYSTCTISRSENELQISALCDRAPELRLDDVVQTLPHRDATAGFFIARLHRSAG
jgi:16S rRNA (cytosine967-C5)-methyltransferase